MYAADAAILNADGYVRQIPFLLNLPSPLIGGSFLGRFDGSVEKPVNLSLQAKRKQSITVIMQGVRDCRVALRAPRNDCGTGFSTLSGHPQTTMKIHHSKHNRESADRCILKLLYFIHCYKPVVIRRAILPIPISSRMGFRSLLHGILFCQQANPINSAELFCVPFAIYTGE